MSAPQQFTKSVSNVSHSPPSVHDEHTSPRKRTKTKPDGAWQTGQQELIDFLDDLEKPAADGSLYSSNKSISNARPDDKEGYASSDSSDSHGTRDTILSDRSQSVRPTTPTYRSISDAGDNGNNGNRSPSVEIPQVQHDRTYARILEHRQQVYDEIDERQGNYPPGLTPTTPITDRRPTIRLPPLADRANRGRVKTPLPSFEFNFPPLGAQNHNPVVPAPNALHHPAIPANQAAAHPVNVPLVHQGQGLPQAHQIPDPHIHHDDPDRGIAIFPQEYLKSIPIDTPLYHERNPHRKMMGEQNATAPLPQVRTREFTRALQPYSMLTMEDAKENLIAQQSAMLETHHNDIVIITPYASGPPIATEEYRRRVEHLLRTEFADLQGPTTEICLEPMVPATPHRGNSTFEKPHSFILTGASFALRRFLTETQVFAYDHTTCFLAHRIDPMERSWFMLNIYGAGVTPDPAKMISVRESIQLKCWADKDYRRFIADNLVNNRGFVRTVEDRIIEHMGSWSLEYHPPSADRKMDAFYMLTGFPTTDDTFRHNRLIQHMRSLSYGNAFSVYRVSKKFIGCIFCKNPVHAGHECPLHKVPGWFGPTPDDLPALQAVQGNTGRGGVRGGGRGGRSRGRGGAGRGDRGRGNAIGRGQAPRGRGA